MTEIILPTYITLTEENIDTEHICCAFSDKKCLEGYKLKRAWLKKDFKIILADSGKRTTFVI